MIVHPIAGGGERGGGETDTGGRIAQARQPEGQDRLLTFVDVVVLLREVDQRLVGIQGEGVLVGARVGVVDASRLPSKSRML